MRSLTSNVSICLKSIAATKKLIEEYREVFNSVTTAQETEQVQEAFRKGGESLESFMAILTMVEELITKLDLSRLENKITGIY